MSTVRALIVLAVALVLPRPAPAAITTYSSRAAFNAAAPGLPVDTFPSTVSYQAYPLNYYFHTSPVSAATNDGIFQTGSILPGVTISAKSPVFASQALKIEPVAGGNQVAAATFGDTLILDFSPAVSAVGFDVSGHVYTYPLYPGHVEVAVYSGATRLYSNSNVPVPTGSQFVGFTSTARNITRVTLLYVEAHDEFDTCTFISNLAFDAACEADFDGNGFVNGEDFDSFVTLFEAGDFGADIDGNGFVTGDDFDFFITRFVAGC